MERVDQKLDEILRAKAVRLAAEVAEDLRFYAGRTPDPEYLAALREMVGAGASELHPESRRLLGYTD